MHMADALISPAVGGVMWAATAGLTVYSARKVKQTLDDRHVPLMGVLGAFVFCAMMINFSIPATGSSGHIGGGMLLSILLGPYAAFLTIASVLTVQALFFADGGLLALGCNVFNLGFFPCFVAYPLIYRVIAGKRPTGRRIVAGTMLSAIIGLQLGAFGVVMETIASSVSSLPFGAFVLLMQPIHLAIGLVEGLATAAIVIFVWRARPELVELSETTAAAASRSLKPVLLALLAITVVTGGALSWFASTHPDGLEWALFRATGREKIAPPPDSVHKALADTQQATAFLPDYGFKQVASETAEPSAATAQGQADWPSIRGGTSLAGVVGGALTLLLAALVAVILRGKANGKT